MKKILALAFIALIIAIVSFSTVQLYRGNLEAAFSTAPFLLVLYILLQTRRR